MKIEEIEETLSNLDIAERQLERAIVLFLDDKDYVSALTLAGAAEEILGKLLNKAGKEHWLDSITEGALRALGFRKSFLRHRKPNLQKRKLQISPTTTKTE